MKKTLTFTSLAVVAGLALVSPARGQQTQDIVDTAVAAGSFKTLAKALENLLKPENKAMLVRVLTYHVVPGKVMAADVVKLSSAKAVSGDALTVKATGTNVTVDKARVRED